MQHPVYYLSEALQGSKTRYAELEKLAYTLLMASLKLRHYFMAHKITILSSCPLGLLLHNKHTTGRIGKWATELAPSTSTSSLARSSSIRRWPTSSSSGLRSWRRLLIPRKRLPGPYTLMARGASLGGCSGHFCVTSGLFVSPKGQKIPYTTRLKFRTTNNAAECEALLLDLSKAKALGAQRIIIERDSRLMAGHIDKSFQTWDPKMARYLGVVRALAKYLFGITVQADPCNKNEAVDELGKMASFTQSPLANVFYEVLKTPSVSNEVQGDLSKA